MIIICSDHGDYLGDHWLGEKQLFHDPSVRIPLIIRDPQITADGNRGTVSQDLVELIDIVPTLLDLFGGDPKPHILEGRSLLPFLAGRRPASWRDFVVSEYNYREDRAYWALERSPVDPTVRMIADGHWKLMQFEDQPPMLFDRLSDPQELHDVAGQSKNADIVKDLLDKLFYWARNPKTDICTSPESIKTFAKLMRGYDTVAEMGCPIGYWSEDELAVEREKKRINDLKRQNP